MYLGVAYSSHTISTHTPLAGRDVIREDTEDVTYRFLLTRPLRDVTQFNRSGWDSRRISTHTPLAGRDVPDDATEELINQDFYSHAPCGT